MVSSGSTATRRRSAAAASAAAVASRAERAAGGKRKRPSPGRPGRNAQTTSLHAKEAHEAEAEALTSGIGQLEKFIERLRLIKSGTKPEPDDSRDWLSAETLTAMTEVIDENPRPSLEYVLGVLGSQEVPKRLAERQRSQGARAFTAHLRNRAIRRKREAMEEKRKRPAEKPALAAAKKKKSAKAERKEEGETEKGDASPVSRETVNVDATAKTRDVAEPDSSATGKGTVNTGDIVEVQGTARSEKVDKESEIQMKAAEPDNDVDIQGEKSTSNAALAKGAAKLETAVKNGLGEIATKAVDTGKLDNDAKFGDTVNADEAKKSIDPLMSDEVMMSDEAVIDDSATITTDTQTLGHVGESEKNAKKSEPVAKSPTEVDETNKPSRGQLISERDSNPESIRATTDNRGEVKNSHVRPEQEVQTSQSDKATEAKGAENPEQSKKSDKTTASKGMPPSNGPTQQMSTTDQKLSLDAAVPAAANEKSDPDTVMKEARHLHDDEAGGADHRDERANPIAILGDEQGVSGKARSAGAGDKEKMEVSDINNACTKPISTAHSMRGVPLKKREKTAADVAGKARKVIKSSEYKVSRSIVKSKKISTDEIPQELVTKLSAKRPEAAKNRVHEDVQGDKIGQAMVDVALKTDSRTTGKSLKPSRKAERKGKRDVEDGTNEAAETGKKGKSDTAALGSAKTKGSPRKAEVKDKSSKEPRGKNADKEQEESKEEMTDKLKEEKQEKTPTHKQGKYGNDRYGKITDDKQAKMSEASSPKKATHETKENKKVVKKYGRSPTDALVKDGKDGSSTAQKAVREGAGGPGKGRKPKETENSRERRVGSRRLSYFRGDLVHSNTPQTRLRRESSHLRDPTSLPPDTDPFIVDCFHVWKTINQNKITIPFQKPVAKKDAPGYFDVIKHPMDLSTVRQHLEDKTIKTPQQFYDEMMLICSNALLFNDVESDLYDLALELRQKIKKAVKPVLKEWRESLTAAKKENTTAEACNAANSDDDSRRSPSVDKHSSSSSESEDSSHATDAASAQQGKTRYPSRRSGDGASSATRPTAGRGRKKKSGRGRGRGRGGRPRRTDNDSDDEAEGIVVVTPSGRGRGGRGRRGGAGRRGGVTRENVGPGRKAKRGRPPADDDREEGRKKRRVSGRKRRDED